MNYESGTNSAGVKLYQKYRVFMGTSLADNHKPTSAEMGVASTIGFTWNTDFLLGSFMHSPYASSDTSLTGNAKWCSPFMVQLAAASVEFVARNGFSGKTKCTW